MLHAQQTLFIASLVQLLDEGRAGGEDPCWQAASPSASAM